MDDRKIQKTLFDILQCIEEIPKLKQEVMSLLNDTI